MTIVGTLLVFLPAAFAYRADYLWAGITLAVVSILDGVDGSVARATGRATPFGGFLDSVLDRFADAVFLLALALSDLDVRWLGLIGAGLVGQFLTSYTRARAYQEGPAPPETWNQFFERPERIAFWTLALILQGTLDRWAPGPEILLGAAAVFAVLTLATAVQRVLRVRALLEETKI